MPTTAQAKIYRRRNGTFGAECDGIRDTGHRIMEDGGRFTIYSMQDVHSHICRGATKSEAEAAIAADWRADAAVI